MMESQQIELAGHPEESKDASSNGSVGIARCRSEEDPKLIVVLGHRGTGKTSLCNFLVTCCLAENESSSETQNLEYNFVSHHLHKEGVTVIDTPGLGADNATDHRTLERLQEIVRRKGEVTLFLLTVHGQHPRLTDKHQETLRFYASMFGSRFLRSTLVVFTHWYWDQQSEDIRHRSGETEGMKTKGINEFFQKTFSTPHPVPTLFVDQKPDLQDNKQNSRLLRTRETFRRNLAESQGYSWYL